MAEKIAHITDIEAKLHLKNRECIQLKAYKTKNEDDQMRQSICSQDLKECIQNQDKAMLKMLNSIPFNKNTFAKAFMNPKS